MYHTNKHNLSPNGSPSRKPYIAPCVVVETLVEDVNFLAGSGVEAGFENFKHGGGINDEYVDEQ